MTVPVVFGPEKEDVLKIAPKNSFIFAEDFETPKDLVDYLDYLDGNDTAYLEYHKWRNAAPEVEHKEYIHHRQGKKWDALVPFLRQNVYEKWS